MSLAIFFSFCLYFFSQMVCIKYSNTYLCITLQEGDVAQLVEHRTENP